MKSIIKFPRTPHLEGSRIQPGDEDIRIIPPRDLSGLTLVIEEKVDGANSGVSFDEDGCLILQCRGHVLSGGPRERQFDLFKRWANHRRSALWGVLGARYVMYGEWLYTRHTIRYDHLPHYFLEFDLLDSDTGEFLSTERRRKVLNGIPVVSVPVLVKAYLTPSTVFLDRRDVRQPSEWKVFTSNGKKMGRCLGDTNTCAIASFRRLRKKAYIGWIARLSRICFEKTRTSLPVKFSSCVTGLPMALSPSP